MTRPTIFVTHSPAALENYYGPRALAALRAVAEVRLNPSDAAWTPDTLATAARGCEIIVSDRSAEAGADLLDQLPALVAFWRCAVDIRNIGAFFINASRGNLVDEAALLQALDSGHVAGCALDVGRAPDQMPSSALARHRLVIATPHIGGLTPQAIQHQSMETAQQVAELAAGRVPAGAVNPRQASRLQAFFDRH